MSVSDLFKLKQIKEENEALAKECAALRARCSDLESSVPSDALALVRLKAEVADLQAEHQRVSQNVQALNRAEDALRKQILVDEETIELETFSLYTPRFDFVKSEEYKLKLNDIRAFQKMLIKNGQAVFTNKEWTLNGSKSAGNKFMKDLSRLALRAFNNECDAAVASVKFNNYDRCSDRITKAAQAINALIVTVNARINDAYIGSKIDELRLSLEYAMKKQDEKEELRLLKAQQREDARLAKELAEARKASEKELAHYEKALNDLLARIENETDPAERSLLSAKKAELTAKISEVSDALKQIDYREASARAGYVYVISNIGSFGAGVYKIGMTRRLDPMERVAELGDASVPFGFDVHAMIFTNDAPKLEAALHAAFDDKRLNVINRRREFFKVSLDEIKRVVKENHDKTVDFVDVAQAAQYRESLMSRAMQG